MKIIVIKDNCNTEIFYVQYFIENNDRHRIFLQCGQEHVFSITHFFILR